MFMKVAGSANEAGAHEKVCISKLVVLLALSCVS